MSAVQDELRQLLPKLQAKGKTSPLRSWWLANFRRLQGGYLLMCPGLLRLLLEHINCFKALRYEQSMSTST